MLACQAWNAPDSYAFAEAVVKTGSPWCLQTESVLADGVCRVSFRSAKTFDRAILISTTDDGITGKRKWTESTATLQRASDQWIATATLPPKTTAWFLNLRSGELVVSSEFRQLGTIAKGTPAASTNKARLFARMDKDSNGKVTNEEYLAHYSANYDRVDADKDGKLTAKEFPNGAVLKLGDTNKDGTLTRTEYQSVFERQFSNLDKNKDGLLTAEEL